MRLVREPTQAEIVAVHAALAGPAPDYDGPTNTLDRANLLARHVASALLAAAPVVPAGSDGVAACLLRVTDHLEAFAADHPDDATTETAAAIWCAREALAACARPPAGEAVAWRFRDHPDNGWIYTGLGGRHPGCEVQPLYAHPADPAAPDGPQPVHLFCPVCAAPHLDEGEWATRPHKTHQCQGCGHEWRPFPFATVGVSHPVAAPDGGERERVLKALEHYTCSCEPGHCAMSADDSDTPVADNLCGRTAQAVLAALRPAGGEGAR